MVKISFICCMLMGLFSCGLLELQGDVPAYIQIDELTFIHTADQGPPEHDISVVQVFFEGQSLGFYDLPLNLAVIPTQQESELVIQAAVEENGLEYAFESYAMTTSFTQNQHFEPGETYHFDPEFRYRDNITFAFAETFENQQHIFKQDVDDIDSTSMVSTTEMAKYGLKCGLLEIKDGQENFVANDFRTSNLVDGGSVFLELDYKSEVHLSIGFIGYSPGVKTITSAKVVKPTEEWKKLYLELTLPLLSYPAEEYSIFLAADNTAGDGKAFVDNVKLLYRN